MTPAPTPLPPRYGRLRLDGDLDEFHHALNALRADTCERGRCTDAGMCSRHERLAERRRQRQDGGGST